MPYNINSLAMKKVIEELPNVGSTSVSRADILGAKSFGYEWIVTFTSIESPSNIGVQDLFKIDDAKLMGTSVVTEVMRLQSGCCEFSLPLKWL